MHKYLHFWGWSIFFLFSLSNASFKNQELFTSLRSKSFFLYSSRAFSLSGSVAISGHYIESLKWSSGHIIWVSGGCRNCNYAPKTKSHEFPQSFIKRTRIQQTTCRVPRGFPPASCTAHSPSTSWSLPGSPAGEEGWMWKCLKENLNLHLHPSLSQSKKTSLSADCLDVSSREVVLKLNNAHWFVIKLVFRGQLYLWHDVLFQVYIFSQSHFSW